MSHTSHQTDIPGFSRLTLGSRTWRSWAVVALVAMVAGLALVQVPGSDVSAATLETAPIELPLKGAPTPLPEIMEALPFP